MRPLAKPGSAVSVVCVACSEVARVPIASLTPGPWTCPSCGAIKPDLLEGFPATAVPALDEVRGGPVFSETFTRPRPAGSR
jgi:hypothetical protein